MRTRHPSFAVLLFPLLMATAVVATQPPAEPTVPLPNKDGSLKFAVLGDFGTGDQSQYELADQMAKLRQRFKYELVVLVGDNLYGSERPQDFAKKFELPYKPLLDAGVKFYASLGNHDAREQRFYKLFNMEGSSTTRLARSRTSVSSRSRAATPRQSRSSGWKRSSRHRVATGKSSTSITRCTRQATGTARISGCAKRWSRCS